MVDQAAARADRLAAGRFPQQGLPAAPHSLILRVAAERVAAHAQPVAARRLPELPERPEIRNLPDRAAVVAVRVKQLPLAAPALLALAARALSQVVAEAAAERPTRMPEPARRARAARAGTVTPW